MIKTDWIVVLATAALFVSCVGCGRDGGEKRAPSETETSASALDRGASALDAGDWTRAYDAFADAIADDPKSVDAYFGRAAASSALAENRYRLAQAATTNKDVATGQAEAAKADEYFKQSLADCDKVLELDPKFAEAYFLRGVAAQYQANWNVGIESFGKCVEIAPDRAEAYHRRGEIYNHIGDYMNAEVDFKKAAELGYRDADQASESTAAPEPTDAAESGSTESDAAR